MLHHCLNSLSINVSHWTLLSGASWLMTWRTEGTMKSNKACGKMLSSVPAAEAWAYCWYSVCMFVTELFIWRQSLQWVTASRWFHLSCKTLCELWLCWFDEWGNINSVWNNGMGFFHERDLHWISSDSIDAAAWDLFWILMCLDLIFSLIQNKVKQNICDKWCWNLDVYVALIELWFRLQIVVLLLSSMRLLLEPSVCVCSHVETET